MKTCHSCGTEVEDKRLVCPVCGATVVKATGDFSLKPEDVAKKKKKGNPMGTHVSTGSGLTDILKGDDSGTLIDEEDFQGGSIPTSYSKTDIDDLGTKSVKKSYTKLIVCLVIVLVAVAFLLNMYTTYKNGKRGMDSYEGVVYDYVASINSEDRSIFDNLMPKYMEMNTKDANDLYKRIKELHINSKSITSVSHMNSGEVGELQEDIKLHSTKTSAIQDAVVVKVELDADVKNPSGSTIKKSTEVKLIIICVRDRWFLEPYNSEVPFED